MVQARSLFHISSSEAMTPLSAKVIGFLDQDTKEKNIGWIVT